MSDADILQEIERAINAFAGYHSLKTGANGLFDVLGYRSKRQIEIAPNTAAGFKAMFAPSAAFRDDRAMTPQWRSVDMLNTPATNCSKGCVGRPAWALMWPKT
jgi:hypothetical protein